MKKIKCMALRCVGHQNLVAMYRIGKDRMRGSAPADIRNRGEFT